MPARSKVALRVVDAAPPPADAGAELASLFALEDALVGQLADCRKAMNDARARYGAQQGFRMLPRLEALRASLHRPTGPRP